VAEVMKKYPLLEGFSYSPTDTDIADDFERSLYHMDAPMAGSSPVSQYFVMKLAAQQKIKVLLDGKVPMNSSGDTCIPSTG
jgi:asparagine synthase (glutamine-hydrolysing)